MWPTIDGMRVLDDAEAELVRRAIAVMTDRLAQQLRRPTQSHDYGIDWFDQWDVEQQLWLLDRITAALLTSDPPPPPAAIWEATIDAIFCEVVERIEQEINDPSGLANDDSWRHHALHAGRAQRRDTGTDPDETDLRLWRMEVTRIADAILVIPAYQKAEWFRDRDIDQTRRFLQQKGLPEDFLERIPPVRTRDQAEESIARIEAIIAR